jgi:hypothetical protein
VFVFGNVALMPLHAVAPESTACPTEARAKLSRK